MARRYRSRARSIDLSALRRRLSRAERGQAIVIIGMAILGLLAFIGLTVDAGILFIGVGHLRRAVDAAALAAASQIREGRSEEDLTSIALEVIALNAVDPTTVIVATCDNTPGDAALCTTPRRKLVRVTASMQVDFAFLTLIGWHNAIITANAQSEAASVDVVLAIDTSDSMANDASCTDGTDDNGDGLVDNCTKPSVPLVGRVDADPETDACRNLIDDDGDGVADDGCAEGPQNSTLCSDGIDNDGDGLIDEGCRDDYYNNPDVCNYVDLAGADGLPGECHPFEEVKAAADSFVERLNYPYDRVAVVTYDLVGSLQVPITNTLTVDEIRAIVQNLQVSARHFPGDGVCTFPPDPSGCVNTSIGGGLKISGGEFGRAPIRQEAVWVVILLSDGAANASEPNPATGNTNPYCPNTTWFQPFCRDADWETRHSLSDTVKSNPDNAYDPASYDADDFARDMADFVACAADERDAALWCHDSLDYANDQGGQGALIYAIGLGQLVVNFTACDLDQNSLQDPDPTGCDKDAGDRMLRYAAAVGDDGNPQSDPCAGIPVPTLTTGNDSYNCGNYYFSEFGTGLTAIFESIASRIFTRLTQ